MSSGSRFTFDRFELDAVARSLTRAGEPLTLPERHFDVLLELVSRPGAIVSKDALIDAAWRGVAVTDNSLEQAVSALRRTIGNAPDGQPYIRTVPRQGYRFAAAVTRSTRRESDEGLDALLAPHRAWLEGRAALETLGREEAAAAQEAFQRAVDAAPDLPVAHVGLANACAFRFEATRADEAPDIDALRRAVRHAREACRLDPSSGEAWVTLGFVLSRSGDIEQAVAAARRGVALEPGNWRHHVRLASIGWGEERLRAAARALQLLPGLALAHWLAASVHVARDAFVEAEQALDSGAAAQDAQHAGTARFSGVGLHWLRGLVRLRRGDLGAARESLERELAFESSGHLYARECCANTAYALSALRLREDDRAAAIDALEGALARVPGYIPALAARVSLSDASERPALDARLRARLAVLREHGAHADAAVAEAIVAAVAGDVARAAATIDAMLDRAGPGPAAWTVPIDPFLRVAEHPDQWSRVLARLRSRAA